MMRGSKLFAELDAFSSRCSKSIALICSASSGVCLVKVYIIEWVRVSNTLSFELLAVNTSYCLTKTDYFLVVSSKERIKDLKSG